MKKDNKSYMIIISCVFLIILRIVEYISFQQLIFNCLFIDESDTFQQLLFNCLVYRNYACYLASIKLTNELNDLKLKVRKRYHITLCILLILSAELIKIYMINMEQICRYQKNLHKNLIWPGKYLEKNESL
jgi:hypothetical protein